MHLDQLSELILPIDNPVLKFLLILLIILLAPIALNRLKIPPLLGLIIAGAVVGPKGLNWIERDSSIILSGTAGMLYIMFLAGLEIDLADFRKNSKKSIVFGMYTFLIPMILGMITGLYILNFGILTSILLASMFASHTLIAYPMISKMGIAKNKAVNITVGGTLITDTLALLVLAIVVGATQGEVNTIFWTKLVVSLIIFTCIILFLLPMIARWFLKKYEDSVSQYVFCLVLVFLGAALAELAGVEPIIGAFLVGLAVNPLISHTSPLMNRIEFVGNAIFIPFFLIGVGMLVDFSVFINGWEAILVAIVMTVVATLSKYLAALATQKTYGFSKDERRIIFGLSNAQAAATLAAVTVGYKIIIGTDANGEPIRLLSEYVLNGTIIMILVTCTIASLEAQKGAKRLVMADSPLDEDTNEDVQERILIPVRNQETSDELIHLSIMLKSPQKQSNLYALSIINPDLEDTNAEMKAQKTLNQASKTAGSTDHFLYELLRYDTNVEHGISGVIHENKITDLVLGLHEKSKMDDSFLGNLTEGLLSRCNTTTFIYKPHQPFDTHKRHLVFIPPYAEKELGFPFWLVKVWNIARNSGARMIFYASEETREYLGDILQKHPIRVDFRPFPEWDELGNLNILLKPDDNLIMVLSRKGEASYHPRLERVPQLINIWLKNHSFILIYPNQPKAGRMPIMDMMHGSLIGPIERLDWIGRTVASLLKRK
ncbi:cation:proton antiporter [Algoriphagus aquimarinus]|uniref:Kef-type K+ transport system, membrane component KefB n=1 Tax=Algoriphagus aquimarinus TaxID=237018 RepID=A0A1I0WKZ0_9BACT|nr:cation:proton antiporter [Algoriphagus aquimarinus]SFA89214.1 Kef-type K+ transport system, membrane component KefB [Algoriphagus aquimarinus]|tara:strand:- start:49418 stop:51565 length:2148 start_codon:yes stop_codon:yes gene_type:complete